MQTLGHERKTRRDKGLVRWTERDLVVLRWMAEQYVMGLDQLQVLLGRWSSTNQNTGSVARTTASNEVTRWQRADAVKRQQILVGQPTCIWLTRAGLALLDVPYQLWTPKPEGLTHLLAINQVRLWVEQKQPEAIWCSERQLRSERPITGGHTSQEHRPDAEVLLGSKTVAIEVERSAKTPQRLPAILYGLARTYDGIWYFCPRPQLAPMQRAMAQLDSAVRRKFSLVELPQERASAAGRLVTLPPPTEAPGRDSGR